MALPSTTRQSQLNIFQSSASVRAAIACRLQTEGFSIIPLIGGNDQNTGKRPALPWKHYQTQRPTPTQVQQWLDDGLTAYGIVCGQISGIIVLDIDDSDVAAYLARRFPNLMNTYIVRSGLRGTPHIYWRVNFPVKSQSVLGGDLKAEGSYVVGAGSEIAGCVWQVENDHLIRSITRSELKQVLTALRPTRTTHQSIIYNEETDSYVDIKKTSPPHHHNVEGDRSFSLSAIIPDSSMLFTCQNVASIYHAKVKESGQRNTSLFNVACLLRDAGYSKDWTLDALAKIHANEPPHLDQKQETYPRRMREAYATINSAYTRPPRPAQPIIAKNGFKPVSRLPGTIREALLARPERDGTAILRTLEGLYLLGQRPGTSISVPEACLLLKGYVGRHSILKAFSAMTNDDKPLFDTVSETSVRFCPTYKNAVFLYESEPLGDDQSERSLSALAWGSGGNHRPSQFYYIPSPDELCVKLNVESSAGDPITLDDIISAKAYREALEREFINRRPGCYAQSMLADRLNISARTIRRYHKTIPVQSRACFVDQHIGWFNLSCVPARTEAQEFGRGGCSLMDQSGKCYPPYREVAQKLLSKGRKVMYRTRTFNFYWCGNAEPAEAEAKLVENGYEKRNQPLAVTPLDVAEALTVNLGDMALSPISIKSGYIPPKLERPTPCVDEQLPNDDHPIEEVIYVKPYTAPQVVTTARQRQRKTRRFRYPLDDVYAERIANQVYDSIQDMSLCNARRLVDAYGAGAVKTALSRVVWIDERQLVGNPAGYLVAVVGQIWREYHGWNVPKPAFRTEPKRRSRRRKYNLSKDPITKSEAWLRWSVWFWYEMDDMERVTRWQKGLKVLGFEVEIVSDWRDGEESELEF